MNARILAAALTTLLAIATSTIPASPQEPPPADPEIRVLTLHEALAIATGSNPAYRQTLNTLSLAGASRQQVVGRFLPSVTLSAGTGQQFARQAIGTDDFGRPIPNPDVRTTYTSNSIQQVSLGWTLFDGLQRFQELKEQEAQVGAWAGSANARLAQLTADVERTFFEAQLRRDLVAVEEETLDVRRRILDATERMFALASRSRADVLGARVEVQSQERTLESATGQYRQQLLVLRRLMGDPSLEDFDVAETPLDVFDPATLDAEELIGLAHEMNPEVRREESSLALNRATARRQRGTRWPTLDLNGSVGRTEWGQDQSALFELSPSTQSGGSLSLSLSWNIFDRFSRQYEIASADVAHRNAAEALNETRLRVEDDIRRGLIDLQTAYVNLESALGAQELARERLRLAGESYLLAASDFLELQDAVQSASDQARAVVEARFQFVDARITLEQAIGGRLISVARGADGTP